MLQVQDANAQVVLDQVLIVLYFSSDLIVSSYSEPLPRRKELIAKIYEFTARFLIEDVSVYIHSRGGWVSFCVIRINTS